MRSLTGDDRTRLVAMAISLVVSIGLLAAKFQAYRLTGSTAILSDALESIVNVVAAVFAIGALIFAGRPADRNHPYGHGKMEFLSAAFEGGQDQRGGPAHGGVQEECRVEEGLGHRARGLSWPPAPGGGRAPPPAGGARARARHRPG